MQTRDLVQPDKPASPKFIVTLDGVPSPPGYMSDQEEDMCFEGMKPVNQTAASNKGLRGLLHPQQLHLLSRQLEDPNCKYDAKCTKPDCPFTHVSRRIPVLSPKPAVAPPAPPSSSQLCRYFPACKKMECPFYHPKHCRFNTQCTRPDFTFYHPTINVPPRHALKWIRPQTSE
nr:putative NY-REN-37 antigen isoform 4 [Homo sapiens]